MQPLRHFSLLCLVYVTVCAGPFGLEEFVRSVGPELAFALLLLTPIFWGLPLLFMSAELAGALPLEGGLYRWVKTAFGDFWGFQAGWWWWLSSFLDCAIYAVLVADYVSFFHPGMSALARWGLALAVIWVFTLLNVRGVAVMGMSATFLTVVLLAPFAIMLILGVPQMAQCPLTLLMPATRETAATLGAGLLMSIWFLSGFEALATASGEIQDAARLLPRALRWVFPLILLSYGLPLWVSLGVDGDWQNWRAGHFADIAAKLGGPWLGGWVSLAGVTANLALFGAWLLSYARIPFAMAADGHLPATLCRLSPRYGTPVTALVVSAMLYSVMAWFDFRSLVEMTIWLILPAMFLEFLALAKLRHSHPDLPRRFRVPGGRLGLVFTVISPIGIGLFAMFGSGTDYVLPGVMALASGPVAFWLGRRFSRHAPAAGHSPQFTARSQ
ncbi:MAG: APC family permease [candidate division KSB1 bacterium]|nr:APC family permease [candidate division KSB1 bacterium]MDZ7275612.1 APC family permease [candidate division KSB1 bacterium]MDZ7284697.1 APC family permease [candidate division KSB1 bacterium]MDZ7297884.1 APC family permease [candidate division KSB1 bacterium]MDZ7305988.1 APC family permease [candidate division KSB1 bacterium]